MQILDPHIHLFNLQQGQYGWLRSTNPPAWPDKSRIYQDFTEADLRLPPDCVLAGYVHIEAGFDNQASWREVDWLEQQASLALRTVAHLDLTLQPDAFAHGLHLLTHRPSLVGMRHIFDDDLSQLVEHPNTLTNLRQIGESDLHFELQFDAQIANNCAQIDALLTALPKLPFVLNHAGFCPIDSAVNSYMSTVEQLRMLARHPHLSVKASGFEMVNRAFKFADAAQLIHALWRLFGTDRVMVASNFPLITLSISYAEYWSKMIEALDAVHLPVERLIYHNAKRIYRFD